MVCCLVLELPKLLLEDPPTELEGLIREVGEGGMTSVLGEKPGIDSLDRFTNVDVDVDVEFVDGGDCEVLGEGGASDKLLSKELSVGWDLEREFLGKDCHGSGVGLLGDGGDCCLRGLGDGGDCCLRGLGDGGDCCVGVLRGSCGGSCGVVLGGDCCLGGLGGNPDDDGEFVFSGGGGECFSPSGGGGGCFSSCGGDGDVLSGSTFGGGEVNCLIEELVVRYEDDGESSSAFDDTLLLL